MTTSDKLREIAHKYGGAIMTGYGQSSASGSTEMFTAEEQCLSDLTALISENYVEKAKYDEAVRQRDELREALVVALEVMKPYKDLYNATAERNAIKLAEAAIKSTER